MNWDDDWLNDIWRHGSSDREWSHKKKTKRKKEKKMNLSVGDRVRLPSGSRTLVVEYIDSYYVTARYEHSGQTIRRRAGDFVLVTGETEEDKGMNSMKGKLFQTREDTPRFGVGLAVDSQNRYVLEMKNGGGIESFDKKDVEIVMPFTFAIKFSTSNQEYQYLGKEGTVAVGDLLLAFDSKHKNGGISIAQVTKVNTKSDKATKYFEGVKIKTESLDQEQ